MYDVCLLTEKGGRNYNQDYADHMQCEGKICLAVADGLGSYEGSGLASEIAVQTALSLFVKESKSDTVLSKSFMSTIFREAHNNILKAKKSKKGIDLGCTTLAVLISDGTTSVMGHVGDTRIYEIKKNKIYYHSKDHSLAQMAVDRGEITQAQISTHVDQNKLYKVLGAPTYSLPEVRTDFFPLEKSDGFVLCSDGVWEYITNDELAILFVTQQTSRQKTEMIKNFHDKRAPENCDNFTSLVLTIGD